MLLWDRSGLRDPPNSSPRIRKAPNVEKFPFSQEFIAFPSKKAKRSLEFPQNQQLACKVGTFSLCSNPIRDRLLLNGDEPNPINPIAVPFHAG